MAKRLTKTESESIAEPESIEAIMPILVEWAGAIADVEREIQRVRDVFGTVQAPLFDAVYALADRYTEEVNKMVYNPSEDWLDWFWNENDMGRRGLECWPFGAGGRSIKVKTLEDLARVLIAKEE